MYGKEISLFETEFMDMQMKMRLIELRFNK